MNLFSPKAKPTKYKPWLLLLWFAALVVSYPFWKLCVQFLFDPKMPGGLAYTRQEHRNRISFDSTTWKAFPRSTNEWPHTTLLPVRVRMVDDLLAHHDFRGMNRDKVEELLGPKTKTEYFSDWDLVYYLGPGRYGDAVGDSEWLVFRFDKSGCVETCELVHD